MASLSKSRFISGWQCPLKLWFDAYQPGLAPEPDEAQEALFATGREVGELARARWAGGVLVEADHRQVDHAAEETARLMADPDVPALFEGAVVHENTMTRADILARNDDGTWDLIEVKSATRVKEPFDTDVAVQYWILRQTGFPVGRAGLLLLDREYVYPGGALDLEALFRFEDLTADCEARFGEIGQQVAVLQAVLAQEEPPEVGVGEHYCHADLQGSYSIKQVLPVLVPELSYEGMEVADGEAAGRAWLQTLGVTEPAERERLDQALRLYCGQDSAAMYRLREALLAMTRAPHE